MQGEFKTIAIGSDHAAFHERLFLKQQLESWGLTVIDKGPAAPEPSNQFALTAEAVALEVVGDENGQTGGILLCGNGVGMSIAANKIPGVRAAVCNELFTAAYAKRDAWLNVLTMGARVIAPRLMAEIAKVWIETPYDTQERFQQRLNIMQTMENRYRKK